MKAGLRDRLDLLRIRARVLLLLARSATVGDRRPATSVAGARAAAEHQELADRTALHQGAGDFLVVGDSYSVGVGLTSGAPTWAELLATDCRLDARVDGYSSTGVTTRGFSPGAPVRIGERLARHSPHLPRLVVIQGGVNDALDGRVSEVARALEEALAVVSGVEEVVVVGPALVPVAPQHRLRRVNRAMQQATLAAGRTYCELLHVEVPFTADRLHPDADGHSVIAAAVRSKISAR